MSNSPKLEDARTCVYLASTEYAESVVRESTSSHMSSPSIIALFDQYTNGSDYYSDDSELCRTGSEIPTPPDRGIITALDWDGPIPASSIQKTYTTDEDRWRAVLARDTEADGVFLYLVKSTKIYCRPTCPSRRPLRQNVSFELKPSAAIQRGYTACKRCLPDHQESASQRRQAQAIDDAQALLLAVVASREKLPRLEDLAMQVGMSKFHFQRVFKKSVGMSPTEYARSLKLVVDAAASLPS